MMNAEEVIVAYEDVARITAEMLAAARSARWDELVCLEKHCANRVEALRNHEEPVRLPADMRNRKLRMLQQILADDREIRDITEPWMRHLSQVMSSINERSLTAAYGTVQAG